MSTSTGATPAAGASTSTTPGAGASASTRAPRRTDASTEAACSAWACRECVRRSWLLCALGGPLEYCARDRSRLLDLLALDDEGLLAAVGGRRRRELRARHASFPLPGRSVISLRGGCADGRDTAQLASAPGVQRICRHCAGYPQLLGWPAAPPMLEVDGGAARLAQLASVPAVAIMGSMRASDYGRELAGSIARGLSAAGVTVVASLADGIAAAAHAGALEAGGASVAVLGGGLGVACPARWRWLYERVRERGCAISELPADCHGRRFGAVASERIVVGLASVTVLVEAEQTPGDLAGAHIAGALGRVLAAVPGRVTSPLSRATNVLLMDGARLVRGAGDVLELLGVPGAPAPCIQLSTHLRAVLERVGAGEDTPDRLADTGRSPAEVLLALSELEAMGLLRRGHGGRYLPREPLTP
ncbi:MAG TPA: DNA-processing protein DprA [Solirubrobacteraceae bacterium]|nr:DNA-processing protein DprA [Solirubrobacteraceae bacterium]